MRVLASDHHEVPLPEGHPFPMGKYAALRRALVSGGVLASAEIRPAPPAAREDLERVHHRDWVGRVLEGTLDAQEVRRLGFPWSPALVTRSLASVGGTLAAARAALSDGVAGNLAGGTHHAHRDFGAGYCVFNDIAAAAAMLLAEGAVARVLAFDADVHHGDGTAAIFASDPRVFTCSVHGANNFPRVKPPGDLDVALPDGTEDGPYLDAVAAALADALERGRPELVIYQAGVDPLADDRLGRLSVSHDGLFARDRLVLGELHRTRTPVALTLGGGYARPIERSVEAHVGTYRAARVVFG